MEYVTLNNGIKMPQLGFGVYQISVPETERCVNQALEIGYRLLDTAQFYGNEEGVGRAIRHSDLPRQEIFLTTKLWFTESGYERARAAIASSLEKLGLDYIDLFLIHQPYGDYYGAYRALEEAYREGTVKALGVSNFYPDRLIDICHFAQVKPALNQIELHVFQQQPSSMETMRRYGVQPEAWGPLARGRRDLFTNPLLNQIAQRHGRPVSQIALRYLLQLGVVIIPKSTHPERMAENFDLFGFQLDESEMQALATLNEGDYLAPPPSRTEHVLNLIRN